MVWPELRKAVAFQSIAEAQSKDLSKIRELQVILETYGVQVEMVKTRRPGYNIANVARASTTLRFARPPFDWAFAMRTPLTMTNNAPLRMTL